MAAHPNAQLIAGFYAAFDARDGDAMAACYAPAADFSDPVFTDLHGAEPGAMWRMLTSGSDDLRVELGDHHADDTTGAARWVARYTFTPTSRPVVNEVRSTFRFAGGLIVVQHDVFGFSRWARQALGAPGLLLGWTPMLRSSVQRKARTSLDAWMRADGA